MARDIHKARKEAQKIINLVMTPEEEISLAQRKWLVAETTRNFADHINKGFLEYRKSVTEAGDYAVTEWQGQGSLLRDALGREYIDLLGGFGLYSHGIRHPRIVAAVKAQLDRSPQYSQEMLDPLRAKLAQVLALLTPGDIQYGFFANSGTEAVEGAMKLAKLYTRRKGFMAMLRGFHGKTLGSLSLMGKATFREPLLPLLEGVRHVPFGEAKAVEQALAAARAVGDGIAAVVAEPVQGEAGAVVPPDDFWPRLRELCDFYEVLLIADEVQTGFGRTGRVFGVDNWDVAPDIMCLGKNLGGGVVPMSAFLSTPKVWKVMEPNPFMHTTTTGGNPMACAAALANITVMLEEDTPAQARAKGEYVRKVLRELQGRYPGVLREVRGLGLLIGMEFFDNEVGYQAAAGLFARGVLTAGTLTNAETIRFEPALTISYELLDEVLGRLEDVFKGIKVKPEGSQFGLFVPETKAEEKKEEGMYLYAGQVLRVDLTNRRVTTEPTNPDWLKEYWGGWGLAARYFWEECPAGVNALAPENPVVIMTGALCGTLMPTASRTCLVSKSPKTGTIFESNIGGAFGPELKFAGYDGLIITGRAYSPTYLCIKDDQVVLEDAAAAWGKGNFETEDFLKQAAGSPGAKALTIGPAGENLVPFAGVGSEAYRQFGRGGAGAIFGSKNLKGVVVRGTGGVRVADLDGFLEKVRRYKETNLLTPDNLWASTDGTPVLVEMTNDMGIHPTRNFTYGVNDRREALNSEAMKAKKIADRACASCCLACGKYTRIGDAVMEGPEYETLCLAGSNCEINDLEQVIRFNRLCDDLGLDTISAGAVIGLAMDMAEKGRHDFGLRFGQAAEYLAVLPEIARLSSERGRDLALGAKGLAEKYGAADLAVQVKGLEAPAYEPRGQYGMGLAYATSERGACHLRAFTIFSQTPFDHEAMAQDVYNGQNFNAIKWCMCICDFWGTVNNAMFADILTSALGREVTPEELELAGERLWNLTRLFNLREGFTAADDTLPEKMFKEPIKKGPHEGRVLAESDLAAMKKLYYFLRGWDENGRPTPDKLRQLGLDRL
ncbi:MAG: putrescine aminotransferase [Thermodesulfobacteriota bacterium]